MWLVGTIKHIMAEMQHVTVLIRKDYRQLVDNNAQVVVPSQFVFPNIEAADLWVKEVDKNLDRFSQSYDGSDETWKAMTEALTWQPVAKDAQLAASVDTLPA